MTRFFTPSIQRKKLIKKSKLNKASALCLFLLLNTWVKCRKSLHDDHFLTISMCLHLVILNQDSESFKIWTNSFHLRTYAEILATRRDFSEKLGTLDAILLSGQSARERFGGGPVHGISQILASNEKRSPIPPWIVTVPSLHISAKDSSSTRRLYYNTFQTIFRTVKQFNSLEQFARIRSLGIDLNYISVKSHQSQEKAESIRMAYLDCYPDQQIQG